MNPKIKLAMMFTTIMAIGTVGITATTTAFADKPESPNCWGAATEDFAQEEDERPGIGEHASSFAGEPRQGLGNLANHPSELPPMLVEGFQCPNQNNQ